MKEVSLAQEKFLREEKLKEPTTSATSGKEQGKCKRESEKSNATADEEKAPSVKKPRNILPLLPVLGHTGSPRNRRKKLGWVYLRTYGNPGARRDCAIIAVSRSIVGNGVGVNSPYHIPARRRKRGSETRGRRRTTLR